MITPSSFNPWEGCARVSDGCLHCYAETRAHRFGHDVWGKTAPRMWRSDSNWMQPVKWNRRAQLEGVPRRVFCASLADVFEDNRGPMVDPHGVITDGRTVAGERARLWALIAATPWLRWQLLTKRPENITRLVPAAWLKRWPDNVWIGCTVEHQDAADERLPHLLRVPGDGVTFLSAEPLLGPVDLDRYASASHWKRHPNWVIIGGESGPGFRAMDLGHARELRDQCGRFGIPAWFKQVGGNIRIAGIAGGDRLDGERTHQHPRSYDRELTIAMQGAGT